MLKTKEIQIVTFDNPYPANFGGVIDVFYKIKAISDLGFKIYLHIYLDKRNDVSGLKPLCEKIYIYKKNNSLKKHFSLLPYCVVSRFSNQLLHNLVKNDAPIFFESIRTTGILKKHRFKQKTAVRCHNIEHDYSWGLSKSENNLIKKLGFLIEGYKLKYYESILSQVDYLFPLSHYESDYFKQKFNKKVIYLPIFQENESVVGASGFGEYALYHGDLTISDNIKSAFFIIDVFKNLNEPLIIASSTINKDLLIEIERFNNISFQLIIDNAHLNKLIENAHINVLYSFQRSGTKLKVFNALFKGRHCIVNKNMVDDIDVLKLCNVVSNKEEYEKTVQRLFKKEFEINKERHEVLNKYNSNLNAKKLVDILF